MSSNFLFWLIFFHFSSRFKMVRVRGNCSSFGLFLRVFPLLMWKNFLVRRRCWISAIVQILLTVLLAYSFSETLDHKPAEHNKYEASKENINSKLHSPHLCDYTYYYAPKNVDTTNIMQSVHSCLHLKKGILFKLFIYYGKIKSVHCFVDN